MIITNHVFIDYENMRSVDPALFALERLTTITLLLGRQNHSLNLTEVRELMKSPLFVELIRIERDGKDAVDFALTYYLGRKAVTDPAAFFHIVSKDKGYDPLIEHLGLQNVKVKRPQDFPSLFEAPKPITPPAARNRLTSTTSTSPRSKSSPPTSPKTFGPR